MPFDWRAAFLSYLLPGLGQISQGRTAKGVLFMVCLYAMFFYGLSLGHWRNVYIPDTTGWPPVQPLGQNAGFALPAGVPAAMGYRPQFLCQFWIGTAAWPAAVQYANYDKTKERGPIFGNFERAIEEDQINEWQRDDDKHWDLGWVYTVIAGVLNVLVIYDALAGPAFREPAKKPAEATPEAAAT